MSVITLCQQAAELVWQSTSLISLHAHCFSLCILLLLLDGLNVSHKHNMLWYWMCVLYVVSALYNYELKLNVLFRSARDRNLFVVIEERNELESLNQSFAELNLFPNTENPTDVVWKFVSNLKHRPYETTMETFSKLTDVFCKYNNNNYSINLLFIWWKVSLHLYK